MRRLRLELLAASFIGLFQELALIRWLPSAVRVLGYFPNLVLLSAFLGLGTGCLRAGKRSLLWLWPLSLLPLVAVALLLGRVAFTQQSTSEHLWLLYGDLGPTAPVFPDVRPPILILFVLSALSFVAPGQLIAERLERFRAAGRTLAGYCWDLLGSLCGTAAFAAACFAWTRPVAWFSVVALGVLGFTLSRPRLRAVALVALLATVGTVARFGRGGVWSPYYSLDVRPAAPVAGLPGFVISANGSVHQYALDLGTQVDRGPDLQNIRDGYRAPYLRLGRKPGRVLVLGAGTGNDVAVALSENAESVDAVEIDPGIVAIGRDVHPNQPYADPRVRLHVMDARSFLESSTERFDLIVFGTLDSMTRLSALSSVRLDNFVYTEECLRAAKEHLSAQGGVALYFMVSARHIDQHILAILDRVFGRPPVLDRRYRDLFNTIYLSGPAFVPDDLEARRAALREAVGDREPATDDWPYLYLESRGVTPFYLSIILAIAALSVLAIAAASPELRQSVAAGAVDPEMFLLGLAFLLLETRSVTEMSLVWGVSWLTNAVVFGAILAMALLGTVARGRDLFSWTTSVLLLAATLIAGYLVPTSALLTPLPLVRLALSLLFVGPPVFFAATLFAAVFQERRSAGAAFGWNLLGAVAGGLLEFVSMSVGIKALHLIALAAYLAVALLRLRQPPPLPVPGGV